MRKRERLEKKCRNCDNVIPNMNTYCNNNCQQDFQHKVWVREWKEGNKKGYVGRNFLLASPLRRYLLDKADNKCQRCGWNEVNPYTNKVPLEVDHIDGDASNCNEKNLRVLCPNCHSLTETFRNIGNRKSKRVNRNKPK
jgi:Zn finger protein HypA/HybF involved in hydrogenase expression